MIRAEELMIGNWVLDGTKYAQVTSITCDGIIETTANKKSNIELLEPIPITPEILEKNGFTPIYHDKSACKWKEYDNDDNIQSIVIDFKVKRTCEVWNGKAKKSYKGEILCLHELQHIMKICGINKSIEP